MKIKKRIFKYVLRKYGKYILKKYHKQLFGLICYFFKNNIIFIILTSLYYGFLHFIFLGPAYLYLVYFLTGSRITDEVKIPALIGFLVGRFIIIISTLYTPFYRLFNKPHCITTFMVLILVWHWLKKKDRKLYYDDYYDDLDKRKLILLTNLIVQILNYFIVPNSALLRSMNVFIFKCNNKKVFLLFNLVGSLIGYYAFIIVINLIDIFLIKKIFYKIFKRKIIKGQYIYQKIFNILFYLTYLIILGKIPFIFSQKSFDIQDDLDLDDVIMDIKKEQEITQLLKEKKDDYDSKPLLQVFFDYQGWVQPYRYIRNRNTENFVRKEMSQYFFNGYNEEYKFNIFYTYSPNLYNFLKLINKTFSLKDLNHIYIDDTKLYFKWNFRHEFYDRIDILNQLIYDDDEQTFKYSDSIETKKFRFFDYIEIEENKKKIFKKFSLNYNKFKGKEDEILTSVSFLFEHIKDLHEFFTEYKNISKWFYNLVSEVRFMEQGWSLQPGVRSRRFKRVLIDRDEDEKEDIIKSVTITTNPKSKYKKTKEQIDKEKEQQREKEQDQSRDLVFMRYFAKSDHRRNLIKGSMRTKRRKTKVYNYFEKNLSSALFVDIKKKKLKLLKIIINYINDLIFKKKKKSTDEIFIENTEQIEQISVKDAELWDIVPLLHGFRGVILRIHSYLRRHIILPSLIVAKNIGRILLFHHHELHEDFEDFRKETHIMCTFNGVQLSEKELPKQWITEGMQIKILHPFKLRPWRSHKNKERKSCFLTFFGKETNIPFGAPRKQSSFFKPIIKYIIKHCNIDLTLIIKNKKLDNQKELLYLKKKEETETKIINIRAKTIMIKKMTPKNILTKTNTKLFKLSKYKIKRIKSKDYLFSFFVLKVFKISNIIVNIFFKNIIMSLDKIIISTLKYYIEKEENNKFKINKFIFDNIKSNKKFISQAYVFYKILQQTNNETLGNTWKDLLNISKINIENIPQYYNSKMYKIYEYSYFSSNYLNKNDNYLIKQEKLLNFYNNLYSLNKETYNEYNNVFNNENNIINTEYEFNKWAKDLKQYTLTLNSIFDIIRKKNEIQDKKNKDINEEDKIEDIEQTNINIESADIDISCEMLNDNDDENISKIKTEGETSNKDKNEEKISKDEDVIIKKILHKQKKKSQKLDKSTKERYIKNLFQLEWTNISINKKIFSNIRLYSRFVRLIKANKFEGSSLFFSTLKKDEIDLSILPLRRKNFDKLINFNIINYNPTPLKKHNPYEKYIFIQQLIAVSFTKEFINKDILGLCFLPENLLSTIHLKKWRILTNLNLYHKLSSHKEDNFNEYEFDFELFDLFDLYNDEYLYYNSKEVCKFKKYLWPNFRLEDIACMNRYWFNTNNGSRFNILRLKMYIIY
uniref:Translocon at the inner envelope membrane of chloroplasts 214 n=2 Tax=Hydnora visseri TaxID=1329980 RepID=A0A109XFP3_HYDVS|nr:hypothetical protein RF1 [Hydnora visseri]ALZ49991.1 hypothetical protein RF1 [Hydnora visseri]